MNQTLHIFRKDVRRLRWEILAALAVTALFVWAQSHYSWQTLYGRGLSIIDIIDISSIVILVWWYLIARVVHEEPLVGDNAFWLSRPYSRKSLLAAKILFIALFISLPALVAEWTILKAGGFSPVAHITQLLARQGVLTALVLLPAAALAAMTRGLVQFTFAMLAAALYSVVYFLALAYTSVWLIVFGISLLPLLAATLVILILQYGWRREKASLAVVVCTGILLLLFMVSPFLGNAALAWKHPTPTSVAGGSAISLDFDSSQPDDSFTYPEPSAGGQRSNGLIVGIPIRIHGLAQGTGLQLDGGTVSIEDPRTGRWHSDQIWTEASWLPSEEKNPADLSFVRGRIHDELFEEMKSKPATLRISLLLTLFQEQNTPVRLDAHSLATLIPNVGTCFFEQTPSRLFSNQVRCRSAFDEPGRVWVRAEPDSLCTLSGTPSPDLTGYQWRASKDTGGPRVLLSPYNPVDMVTILFQHRNPFSSSSLLNPVKKFILVLPNPEFDWKGEHVHAWPCAGTQLVFTTRQPVAHFRRELEIHDIRLIDYTHD